MTTDTYPQYVATADRTTGEWLSKPEYVCDVDVTEWALMTDTDSTHYDTYEHFPDSYNINSEMRAIALTWTD